jgi:hypothetical protein
LVTPSERAFFEFLKCRRDDLRRTLRKRLRHCAELVGVQPSLFDGVDSIDLDFTPTRRMHPLLVA